VDGIEPSIVRERELRADIKALQAELAELRIYRRSQFPSNSKYLDDMAYLHLQLYGYHPSDNQIAQWMWENKKATGCSL
jgi:hypothetical protein